MITGTLLLTSQSPPALTHCCRCSESEFLLHLQQQRPPHIGHGNDESFIGDVDDGR